MVMKEFDMAGLYALLAGIRSEVRSQMARFPKGRPHRLLPSAGKPGPRRPEKKKMI